jgi:hypothetical protein
MRNVGGHGLGRAVRCGARTLLAALVLGGAGCSSSRDASKRDAEADAGSGGRGASAGQDAGKAGTAVPAAGITGGGAGAAGASGSSGRGGSSGSTAGAGGAGGRAGTGSDPGDAGPDGEQPSAQAGTILTLTYNVAGLPEGLSSSMPERFTPLIGPLLNGYELVLLQETWQTPDPNPLAPLRGYHEILVAASDHPYKTVPAEQPFGTDPRRPTALLSDGLNVFARVPLGDTTRVAWGTCVDTAADCLAVKGFSMTSAELGDELTVHIYNLHMEAGGSAEDDVAREGGLAQLVAHIEQHSQDTALIVGGDFNLHTDGEPAATQFQSLLTRVGLSDACTELQCAEPGSIDKLLFRSSAAVELAAESWQRETDVFVSDLAEPLSDHPPIAVRFAWQAAP